MPHTFRTTAWLASRPCRARARSADCAASDVRGLHWSARRTLADKGRQRPHRFDGVSAAAGGGDRRRGGRPRRAHRMRGSSGHAAIPVLRPRPPRGWTASRRSSLDCAACGSRGGLGFGGARCGVVRARRLPVSPAVGFAGSGSGLRLGLSPALRYVLASALLAARDGAARRRAAARSLPLDGGVFPVTVAYPSGTIGMIGE